MKVTVVTGRLNDGLYVNGRKFMEKPEIMLYDFILMKGVEGNTLEVTFDLIQYDTDWYIENGCLPMELEKVKHGNNFNI